MPAGSYVKRMPWGQQKPPMGYGIDWSHPLASGLVGCWLFNEGAGGVANDLSSIGAKFTTNAQWRNNGLYYNLNKYSEIPYNNVYNITANGFSLIIRGLTVVANTYEYWLVHSGYTADTGWAFGTDHKIGKVMFGRRVEDISPGVSALNVVSTGEYAEFVAVVLPNTTPLLYKNGKLVATGSSGDWLPSTLGICVGGRYRNDGTLPATDTHNYIFDKINILSCALSADEIAALYAEPYAMIEGWNYGRIISVPSGIDLLTISNSLDTVSDGVPFVRVDLTGLSDNLDIVADGIPWIGYQAPAAGVVYRGSLIGDSALIGNGVLIGGGIAA